MNEETLKLIEAFAAKLGTTAEHVWAVLVRQAYVSGWCDLVFYLAVSIAVALTLKLAKKCQQKAKEESDKRGWGDEEGWVAGLTACLITSMILVLVSILSIDDTITKFFNPEYWALRQILSIAK